MCLRLIEHQKKELTQFTIFFPTKSTNYPLSNRNSDFLKNITAENLLFMDL